MILDTFHSIAPISITLALKNACLTKHPTHTQTNAPTQSPHPHDLCVLPSDTFAPTHYKYFDLTSVFKTEKR